MSDRNFMELIHARWDEGKFVCVGLDSRRSELPESLVKISEFPQLDFNRAIIDATSDLAGCYKINIAFYEDQGSAGLDVLRQTIDYIKLVAPDVPIILDAKRGDIGNTNEGYIAGAFHWLGADAITVPPYMGQKSLQPILDCSNKGVIVLCRTSNPGAGEFQDRIVPLTDEETQNWPRRVLSKHNGIERQSLASMHAVRLYKLVAHKVASEWNANGNCGLVVGATYPEELAQVREIAGELPILIPGIGPQGGDLEAALLAGFDQNQRGVLINSSRGIIFASKEADFAEAAREATHQLHDQITAIRRELAHV
jgi:orotidine-5'-phosphate decarboxylase